MIPQSINAKFQLPFDVYFFNDELHAKEKFVSNQIVIDQNDQILRINGELIVDIKDSLYQYISSDGKNITRKNHALRHNFLYYYFLYNQVENDFIVEYIHQKDTLINAFSASYYEIPDIKVAKDNESLQFSIDTFQSVAVLTLPEPLLANKRYNNHLTTFMSNVEKDSIQNLVLDLRNNGGGKTQDFIAGFFVDTAISYGSVHISSIHDATYKRKFIRKLNMQFQISKLLGRFTKGEITSKNIEVKNQFNGQLFILINGNTGSSASNLASFLKEYTNAIIVGEESGGGYKTYNTGGGTLQLPNSKIRVIIRTVKGYNNVSRNQDSDNVVPDYEVPESNYFKTKDDEQLNFVINTLILSNSKLK